jgi:hypothetical protein
MSVERYEIFSLNKLCRFGVEVQLSEIFCAIAWGTLDFYSEKTQLRYREDFIVLCKTKERTELKVFEPKRVRKASVIAYSI